MALDYTDRTSNVGERKEGNENRGADIATGAGAGKEAAKDQGRAISLPARNEARRQTPRRPGGSGREAVVEAAQGIGTRAEAWRVEKRGVQTLVTRGGTK